MDFREFGRRHAGFLAVFAIVLAALLAVDGWLVYKRVRYQREVARLRAGMSDFERKQTDAVLASEEQRFQIMMALLRRQARLDKEIHLAISVDSGRLYLEREGALLRDVQADIGPEKRVGVPPDTVMMAIPRGARTVERVLGGNAGWQVPGWVYMDRGLAVPTGSDRTVKGALGPVAIVLNGGTVIYSPPKNGPLNDSSYVMPGGVRVAENDLKAIVPNIKPGTSVYFY
ncbi:MAG: hypothetical protein ABR543_14615 [Gemmatimonadaceae bacterium]